MLETEVGGQSEGPMSSTAGVMLCEPGSSSMGCVAQRGRWGGTAEAHEKWFLDPAGYPLKVREAIAFQPNLGGSMVAPLRRSQYALDSGYGF